MNQQKLQLSTALVRIVVDFIHGAQCCTVGLAHTLLEHTLEAPSTVPKVLSLTADGRIATYESQLGEQVRLSKRSALWNRPVRCGAVH